jgi:spermidine synthase
MQSRVLLGCLLLSGFSGLAYELLWVRLLALSFGSTTASLSTVLAVFFGGLAVGSRIAGSLNQSVRSPIRAYALIEGTMALLGLGLYPLLVSLDDLFARIDPGAGLSGALVRVFCAIPVLLIPTLLMGATLPLACRALIRDDRKVGSGTALIYGINTLGAGLGAYATTYWLIPELGILRSLGAAAFLNALAAGGAFVLSSRLERGVPLWEKDAGFLKKVRGRWTRIQSAITHAKPSKAERAALLVTLMSGLSFIAMEIVWTRVFAIALHGTIYGVGAVLIAVLAGIGLGGIAAGPLLRRWEDRNVDVGLGLAFLQAAGFLAVLAVLAGLIPVSYLLNSFSGIAYGRWAIHLQLAVVVGCLLPPTFFSGMAFPVLVRRFEQKASGSGRAVARLYTWNTLGSVLGSLVTGFVLLPRLGSETTLLFALLLSALAAALSAVFLSRPANKSWAAASALAICLGLVLYRGFPAAELTLASSTYGLDYAGFRRSIDQSLEQRAFFAEGETSNVLVRESGATRSMSLNGLGQGGYSESPPHHVFESLLVGFVPLAHVRDPRNGLVVGLGAGSTVDYLLKRGVPRLTVLELEPKVPQASDIVFRGTGPARDPRVRLEIADARHFLRVNLRQSDERFDLLTSMPAHPWVAAPIFTKEFFELARDNLSEQGVFSTWFGHVGMPPEAVRSLLNAFAAVFENFLVYRIDEVGAFYLVGSKRPLRLEPQYLAELQSGPNERDHLLLRSVSFLPRRVFASGSAGIGAQPSSWINTDDLSPVEVLAPLKAKASEQAPPVEEVFTAEYLRPEQVVHPEPLKYVMGLLEELLGTPQGQSGALQYTPRVDSAERWVKGLGGRLSAAEKTYFEARILAARGKGKEALEKIAQATSLPGDSTLKEKITNWQRRLSRAQAGAFDPAQYAKAGSGDLTEALDRLDVREIFRDGARPWRAELAQLPVAAEDSVVQGWVQIAKRPDGKLRASDTDWLRREWLPYLSVLKRRSLAATCREIAQASGSDFAELAESCQQHEQRLTTQLAFQAMSEAARFTRTDRRPDKALAAVRWAISAVPGHTSVLVGALEVGIRAGNPALISEVKRRLGLVGWTDGALVSAERTLARAIETGEGRSKP